MIFDLTPDFSETLLHQTLAVTDDMVWFCDAQTGERVQIPATLVVDRVGRASREPLQCCLFSYLAVKGRRTAQSTHLGSLVRRIGFLALARLHRHRSWR